MSFRTASGIAFGLAVGAPAVGMSRRRERDEKRGARERCTRGALWIASVLSAAVMVACSSEPSPRPSSSEKASSIQFADTVGSAPSLNAATPPVGAVAQNTNGLLDAFGIGGDHRIWRNQQTSASTWGGFNQSVPAQTNFFATSTPSVVPGQDGRLELFARGRDNALWHTRQTTAGGAFDPWSSLGGTINSAPAAVPRGDSLIDVYAVGWDGRLWHALQNSPNSIAYTWLEVSGSGAPFGFGPVVVRSDPIATIDPVSGLGARVYMRFADGSFRTVVVPFSGPPQWTNLGGTFAGDPGVYPVYGGTREYVTASDFSLWTIDLQSGAWTGLGFPAPGVKLASSPAVGTAGSNFGFADAVFVTGTDRKIYEFIVGTGWVPLGGLSSSRPVVYVDPATLATHVFIRGVAPALDFWENLDGGTGNFTGWNGLGGRFLLASQDPPDQPASVPTYKTDPQRTGQNPNETMLTTSNVNPLEFGVLFDLLVDGQISAQPLYVPNVTLPDGSTHNAIYVATQTNKVYAFDADSGLSLWPPRDFATYTIPEYPVPSPNFDIGNRYGAVNLSPMIGITSTPVIDLTSNTMYVEAFSGHTPAGGRIPPGNVDYPSGVSISQSTYADVFSHRLHAIDITTGLEKFGGPIPLAARAVGTGDGGNNIFFNEAPQLQRPGLLLQNSTIYLGFGSFADTDPYHGWVMGVPTNFALAGSIFPAFVTTPNSQEGGIWQAGHGLVGDGAGSVYAMTGNGTHHVEPYYAESFVKLPASLGNPPTAFYREPNVDGLDAADNDLGSSGPILLAGPAGFSGSNLLLGGGKEGYIYTLNTTNMSLIQKFSATYEPDAGTVLKNGGSCPRTYKPSHIHGGPAYWNGPIGSRIYVWGERDYIKAFQLDANGRVANGGNSLAPSWCGPAGQTGGGSGGTCGALADVGMAIGAGGCGMPGGSIVISSNGPLGGTGIVWAHHQKEDAERDPYVGATLFALDATDLNKELWDSDMTATDNLSDNAKGVPPVVANGRVYMATFDAQRTTGQPPVVTGRVRVYGLKQNNR